MDSKGKVSFDQGIVVDNNDPDRLGRVKVRMISDGIDSDKTMHKGDDELPWYEPCILGAGYEVGSLPIPPVGSFLWCLECKFDTENIFRVYLGSAYGTGPQNSKKFNAMLTPQEVLETPSEALIDYPLTQLLYKSTEGSFLKFYGDDLAGFELSSGIPIRDAEGKTDSYDTDTYNFVYGDREEILLGVSEMPDPIDKAEPKEPEDVPISKIQLNSDEIFSGIVRDRGGDTFNKQEITPGGIYMTVRGNGGVTSPSENKQLEDSAEETLDDAGKITEKATTNAMKDVTKDGGALDTQNKIIGNEVQKTVATATSSACKLPSKETGMSKKEASMFQEEIKKLAIKLPGGYGFLQSAMAGALQGNFKTLTHHILTQVASTVFSLASALVRDTFNKILSDPKLVNTEEASKFVDKIIGEANLNKLVGKAKSMIAIAGGKLGPFGQMFERVSNTVLDMALSQIGAINKLNNAIGSLANIKRIFDQIRPNINNLIDTGLNSVITSSSKTCIDLCNQALAGQQGLGNLNQLAQFYLDQASIFINPEKNPAEQTDTPSSESSQQTGNNGQTTEQDSPAAESGSSAEQSNTPSEPAKETENKLTKEEEKTITQLANISAKAMKKSLSKAVESVVNTLISKTLNNASEDTEQEVEATEEYENLLYLDADGVRASVPGEEISNAAKMDNNGVEVHVGEECLFQMTPSNIMQFVSDPDYENQSTFIQASDGFETKINGGETDSLEIKSSAEKNETIVKNTLDKAEIIQEPGKITLNVGGENGSFLVMEKDKITLTIGSSNIVMEQQKINITSLAEVNVYAAMVNLGAGVNLGFFPDGQMVSGATCKWGVRTLQSVTKTDWNLGDFTLDFK